MEKKYRVLIVDDEADFSETMAKRFERRNIEAVTAGGCEMALEKLKTSEFDVVIMDVSMPPGLDGIQCLAKVKEFWPKTEVIILTGHASVSSGLEGMKGGAFDYCLKPIDVEELFEKVALAWEKVQITRS